MNDDFVAEVADAGAQMLRDMVRGRGCYEFKGFGGEILVPLWGKLYAAPGILSD